MSEHVLSKSLISLITAFFLPHTMGIVVLFLLIAVDTALGSWYAVQSGSFTSSGMKKTLVKIILYAVSLFSVKLIDVITGQSIGFVINGMFVYLSLVELKSIFENLSRLGLPIPNDILFWIKKLPYGKFINIEAITNIDIEKQSTMLADFIPTINDKKLLKIMSIEWNVWREFSERVIQVRFENKDKFCVKSSIDVEVELAKRVIDNRWKKNKVDKGVIEKYSLCREQRLKEFVDSLPAIYAEHKEGNEEDILKDVVTSLTTALQDLFDDILSDTGK